MSGFGSECISTSYPYSHEKGGFNQEEEHCTLLHTTSRGGERSSSSEFATDNHHHRSRTEHRNSSGDQAQLQQHQPRSVMEISKRIRHAGNTCLYAPSSKSLLLAFLLGYVTFVSVCAANDAHHQQQQPFSVEESNIIIDPETASLDPVQHSSLFSPESSQFHVIEDSQGDCVKITLDEGIFHYKSRGGSRTCGLYLISDPNKIIAVTIEYLDVQCHQGGLISVVDGWELNGAVFPNYEDHEKSPSNRFHDLCVDAKRLQPVRRVFTSSQNAALIQYRIPVFGQGFSVRVEHVPNPRPCNILVQDIEGIFTLENYGRNVNCSVMTIFDSKIRLTYMSTGLHRSNTKTFSHSPRLQKGIYHKCAKLGMEDYVQIGGASSLDTSKTEIVEEMCGYHPRPLSKSMTIFCGMTSIRLVSSGKYSNKVVVEVLRATIDDLDSANYICDLGLGY